MDGVKAAKPGDEADDTPVDVMAEKLDNMLLLIYHYLKEVCKEEAECIEVFEALLQIFDRSVLPTHRLKYTQFILFYTASLHPGLPDKFIEHLCQKIADASEPALRKQACASYIGSYIARCNHLSREQMVCGLQFLGQTALQ